MPARVNRQLLPAEKPNVSDKMMAYLSSICAILGATEMTMTVSSGDLPEENTAFVSIRNKMKRRGSADVARRDQCALVADGNGKTQSRLLPSAARRRPLRPVPFQPSLLLHFTFPPPNR